MVKLDTTYWEQKFDRMDETDIQAINDAFHSSEATTTGFNDDEKQKLSDILIAGVYVCSTGKEFDELYDLSIRLNKNFMVNPILCSPGANTIRTWRYDYRQMLRAIPDVWLYKSINRIYNRLGFSLDDNDVHIIGSQTNLYASFLKFIREEADGRLFNPGKDSPQKLKVASYFNMYIMFDKLGFESINFFDIMAEIGVTLPSVALTDFIVKERKIQGFEEEAKMRSRKRMFPTYWELATTMYIEGK